MNIEKLPKWAQEYIRDLERQRRAAVAALECFEDSQTESGVFYDEMVSDKGGGPSFRRRYVQARGMTFQHAGVELDVRLIDGVIALRYNQIGHRLGRVYCCPKSFQHFELEV